MKISLDKKFKKNVAGKFGKYAFEVGILEDGPHFDARRGAKGLKGADILSQYAGGPVRKKSRKQTGQTLSGVSKNLRKALGVNYLTAPFQGKGRNKDIVNFANEFFKLTFAQKPSTNRIRNLLQAIVRNPMLRGDYGPNSELTKKIKGFDRPTIDTAQLFKAIKARVQRKRF